MKIEVEAVHFGRTNIKDLIPGVALSYTVLYGWELFHNGIILGVENSEPECQLFLRVWIDDQLVVGTEESKSDQIEEIKDVETE